MSLAAAGLYRAKWSQQIHDEWTRNLLEIGYEDLIESLELRDPDDRHVLAVAIRSDADAIITFNQRDFDVSELAKYDIYTEHPDEFVSTMISLYTPRVISVVREMRGRLRNPPKTIEDFLKTLHQQGLPQTVNRLSEFAESL